MAIEEEEAAMKKLVVSSLAYYGLKVFHVFDGREFKACFKLTEGVDKPRALEEFTEAVNVSGFEVLEKFAKEFCRPDPYLSTSAARPWPTGLQSQFVPEPVLKLVAPEMAILGPPNPTGVCPRIWATLSTFVKGNSGHYVSPHRDPKSGEVEAKVNYGVQLQEIFKVHIARLENGVLVQSMNAKYPSANEATFLPHSPTKDCPSFPSLVDADQQSPVRKRDSSHDEGSRHRLGKRLRTESVGEEIEEGKQPGQWWENLAKEWPHVFAEIEEHANLVSKQSEMDEGSSSAHPAFHLPGYIDLEMLDVKNMEEPPYVEKKRKRARGTDERVSGETFLYDSSLKSIGSEKDQRNYFQIAETDSTLCPALVEINVKSQAGSNHMSLEIDLEDGEHKVTKSSWPAPLYGDQTAAKISLPNSDFRGDEEEEEEEDSCIHERQGKNLNTCPSCKKKEEIAFSRYTRLFKDDLTWKQKFLDGENLTCDICASKGKIAQFTDVTVLLSHGRRGFDLRGPEHRGYAKAIENLIQLCEPGNVRTCHSAVGNTSPPKSKRVWPPVIVLENTFRASDLCSDLRNLDNEVTRRLTALVNIDVHFLHKVMVCGRFEGTILIEFPPTRRGLHDANRLHQYFLLTGRSSQDWDRVRDKCLSSTRYATGVQETSDLVKVGGRGEIQSRIYFGYLATPKIMTRLDTFRRLLKWRVREPCFVEKDYH